MGSDSAKGLSSAGEYQSTKGTTFYEATKVARKDQKPVYEANIPADWCFGPVAHGGYLSGLLNRAVSQHLASEASTSSGRLLDTPASCNVSYLAPVLPGSAEIRIETRSLSRSSGHFTVALYQKDVQKSNDASQAASSLSLRTEATVFMTVARNMAKTTLSQPMNPRVRVPASEIFARQSEWCQIPQKESGMSFYKHKAGWECYFRPGSSSRLAMLNVHPEHGPAVFDVWWKLDHDVSVHELGLLADLVGPILFNYEDVRKTHWLSTRQMSVEVVRPPPEGQLGWRWVFCRMELIENAGDRFYCDVTMLDDDGKMIGIARQSCIVRPFALLGKKKSDQAKPQNRKARI